MSFFTLAHNGKSIAEVREKGELRVQLSQH